MLFLCVLTFLVAVPNAHLASVLSTPPKWPNRTILYEMDPSMSRRDQNKIQSVMDDFRKNTCVEWKLRSSTDPDYMVFTTNATFCRSPLGNVGGKQMITLGRFGDGHSCTAEKAPILHFIVHALGFRNEHQRPDRDEYIRMDGCVDEERHCFKFDSMPPESVGYPYDICSIMHYNKSYWENFYHLKLKITPTDKLPPTECPENQLSESDVKKINKWFDCPEPTRLP